MVRRRRSMANIDELFEAPFLDSLFPGLGIVEIVEELPNPGEEDVGKFLVVGRSELVTDVPGRPDAPFHALLALRYVGDPSEVEEAEVDHGVVDVQVVPGAVAKFRGGIAAVTEPAGRWSSGLFSYAEFEKDLSAGAKRLHPRFASYRFADFRLRTDGPAIPRAEFQALWYNVLVVRQTGEFCIRYSC